MVRYYLCDHCGYAWHLPKDDPDGPIQTGTKEPPKD
jgi:rubredoxin